MTHYSNQTVRSFIRAEQTRAVVDFGVSDSKGRALGVVVETWSESFGFGPSDTEYGLSTQAPGLYHFARVTAARGGVAFGATQDATSFLFEADRAAFVAKRTRESRARSLKVAASGK